MVFVAVL